MKNRNGSLEGKGTKKREERGRSRFDSEDNTAGPEKDRIMREKQIRDAEERERKEKALQQIRSENRAARQNAREKEAQMLRPSFGIPSVGRSEPEEEKKRIEEAYGMTEETEENEEEKLLEDIQEEVGESESDKEEASLLRTMGVQMRNMKEQLVEKTQKIEQEMAQIADESAESVPEVLPEDGEEKRKHDASQKISGIMQCLSSDSEKASDGDETEEYNERQGEPPDAGTAEQRKVENRVKLLRQYEMCSARNSRCEAGIGNILFEKAYSAMRTVKDAPAETARPILVGQFRGYETRCRSAWRGEHRILRDHRPDRVPRGGVRC